MPKYLFQASYAATGTKGLLQEGGSGRRAAIEKLAQSTGGSLEAFYFAFGDTDAFVIVDLPDHATACAVSLAVNASGAVTVKTVPLLSVEELDAAAKKTVSYRPPGG